MRTTAIKLVSGVSALVLSAQACGRTETSLGAQYDDDDDDAAIPFGGAGGGAGEGGSVSGGGTSGSSGGSAGVIEDAGDGDVSEDGGPDADAGDADADVDVPDGGDAGDGGCNIVTPDPTSQGTEGPSCLGGLTCAGASCCESLLIPDGGYPMGRSDSGSDAYPPGSSWEQPEHTATISAFYLDRFEVTVGRLRRFVNAYDGTPPTAGAGAHPTIPGSGWQAAWNANMPTSKAALTDSLNCSPGFDTWTLNPGPNEAMPANCVTWYLAFAFCAWDGGRLPTEAEWEKAAAGAEQNRLYPWGSAAPEPCRAGFGGISPHNDVGLYPSGAARWGHDDLAGGQWEWTFDFWDGGFYTTATCSDCANLTPSTWRVIRGGAWSTVEPDRLRSAYRSFIQPNQTPGNVSLRCAR